MLSRTAGFTLLELLLAVSILAAVTTVTFTVFFVATTAWKRGTALVESIHHGDFVIDQLTMALRSAYYSEAGGDEMGFWLEDNGEGARSSDKISWVKLGSALVGTETRFADSPHRIEFVVDDDEDGEPAVLVKAWRIYGQAEDFDPEEDIDPIPLTKRVTGFNCRPAYPFMEEDDTEIEWLDEWENSNAIPTVVEITLYMEPLEDGEDPVEIKRIVGIPVGALSLKGKTISSPSDNQKIEHAADDHTESERTDSESGNASTASGSVPASSIGTIPVPPSPPPVAPPSPNP